MNIFKLSGCQGIGACGVRTRLNITDSYVLGASVILLFLQTSDC